MRIAALLFGGWAVACSAAGATMPSSAEPIGTVLLETSVDDRESDRDPVAELEALLVRVEIENPRYRERDVVGALQRAGMSESLAIAALTVCSDGGPHPRCLDGDRRADLAKWLAVHGTMAAAPILRARAEQGLFEAAAALEAVLVRQMIADARPCTPPTRAEIDAARRELAGFAVIDHGPTGLVARAATRDELDDLAYFMAAIELAGPEIGSRDFGVRSGRTPDEADMERRDAWLAQIETATHVGDLATVQTAGSAYLASLGYPGAIDLDLESTRTGGGARVSAVMHDVAETSEIVGELDVAATLYRRATPGGGMCGTSTGYRWQKQVEGFIRTRERAAGCRAVVAERMLDVDGRDRASAYGPTRLVEAGFDLARLFRGALLTRHRDLDAAAVLSAIEHAPLELRASALARWARRGPEAWEARVHAIEGIADELGRAGVELLLDQQSSYAAPQRARALQAIGAASARISVDECRHGVIRLEGISIGGPWQRPVGAFANGCETQLSERDASRMAQRLRPLLSDPHSEVRDSAIAAIDRLAAPRSLAER